MKETIDDDKEFNLKYYSEKTERIKANTPWGLYGSLAKSDGDGGGGRGGDTCFGDRALNIQHRLASILPIQVILPELSQMRVP